MIMLLKLIQITLMHMLIKARDLIILGVALCSLGKFDEAIKMCDYVLKINPDESMASVAKGKIFKLILGNAL